MNLEACRRPLEEFLSHATGLLDLQLQSIERLSGGAIQENYAVKLAAHPALLEAQRHLVLRCDAPTQVAVSHSRAHEFAILQAAQRAGVRVPAPLFLCTDTQVLGRPFFVMEYKPGVAAPHRLVKEDLLVPDRAALAYSIGQDMACIHQITPNTEGLDFLPRLSASPAQDFVDAYRGHLDALPMPQPAFELGLRWCERHAPTPKRLTLVHRDYRTGNYLVHQGQLSAVLDWEFAHFGDPIEDLGWFFAQCWRFGRNDRRAGGVGPGEALLAGYAEGCGVMPTAQELHYWEVVAHVRWGIIAVQQAERHVSGREPSLELALTGRMPSQLAHSMLRLMSEA